MQYALLRTAVFERQLSEIVRYIAVSAGDAGVALRYLDKIEDAVMQLAEFPYMGVRPKYRVLQRKGYRVLSVEKHLVFYKVHEQEKRVILYAVIDGRREYRRLV
ncbi:MAG: type II toxin-antitoxin system RelE/ParE family toxin [Schwartzia succinivorans]|jgi:toxin ParE1/3/4|nr:type II toxin-antitoxin system RelE/ParE family toxin [Schwartzia succinivorans]